ncbi:hypothetical protein AURDEDRAFT_186048 [Auricularia subglabra TFB-10046 SS5]|nr:hypothetical protein AURDEDRAFT_186048 [Auricularia subglabra TFB-10046 SS5]
MDPFHEFRATSSHLAQPDAFGEFRSQTPTGSSMPSGDAFPEFRDTPSTGMDSFPEFRPSRSSVSSDSFEEFRASMSLTGADGFSEFRAPPSTSTSGSRKPRQLLRRFLRLAPVLERASPVMSAPLIVEEPQSEELRVTVPVPVEHAADVHVHLHSSSLVVEADDAIHTIRKIALPSAVLPSASAAFKDGKLAVTLHKCASPVDDEIHNILVH